MAKKAPSTELTAVEYFALLRASKKHTERLRDELKPGSMHKVDVEVRVSGMISVGLPQPREEHIQPDLITFFALVLDNLPTGTRPKLENALNALFKKHLEGDWPSASPEMRAVASTAVARWTRVKPGNQRGAVSGMIETVVLARQ